MTPGEKAGFALARRHARVWVALPRWSARAVTRPAGRSNGSARRAPALELH